MKTTVINYLIVQTAVQQYIQPEYGDKQADAGRDG